MVDCENSSVVVGIVGFVCSRLESGSAVTLLVVWRREPFVARVSHNSDSWELSDTRWLDSLFLLLFLEVEHPLTSVCQTQSVVVYSYLVIGDGL